jgi:hypothetical protein
MSLNNKLWVMWGVMAATTVLVGIITDNFPLTMGFAVVSAGAGWAAFLTR